MADDLELDFDELEPDEENKNKWIFPSHFIFQFNSQLNFYEELLYTLLDVS